MPVPDTSALKTAFALNSWLVDWATALVVAGLIVEFVDLLLFSKEMSRAQRAILAIGSVMVAVGVGGEWIFGGRAADAASQLQRISDERIAELGKEEAADNKIATTAAAQAAGLGVSVGTLRGFVMGKQRQIDADFSQFKTFAAAEKTRADAVIADLNARQHDLLKARDDAVASAVAAAKTVSEATVAIGKQQADLAKVRADLSNLSSRALVIESENAPRQIDDAKFSAMVTALKPYAKTPVDFSLSEKGDSGDLAIRLFNALSAAGWSPKACSSGQTLVFHGDSPIPVVCSVYFRGVSVTISQNDMTKLAAPSAALNKAIIAAGISPSLYGIVASKKPDGTPNPNAVPPGAVHLTVGEKP